MWSARSFWGILLVVVGGWFLLGNLGLLPVEAGALILPSLLVAIGVWILAGSMVGRRSSAADVEQFSVPLDEAKGGRLRLRYGAGRLRVGSGAGAGEFLSGEFVGGVEQRSRRRGDSLELELQTPERSWFRFFSPWEWSRGFDWTISLNAGVPTSLEVESGATESQLDLASLQVRELTLKTGASSTEVTLPEKAGVVPVRVEAGAASVVLRVPQGVAARIRGRGGLADIKIDTGRFPRTEDGHQSPDYQVVANKLDIDIQVGVGSVEVR